MRVEFSIADHGCFSYGRKSITRRLQVQIVEALRSNQRSRASSLLSELGRGNHSLRANDFIYILEYCSRSPDPLVRREMNFWYPRKLTFIYHCFLLRGANIPETNCHYWVSD